MYRREMQRAAWEQRNSPQVAHVRIGNSFMPMFEWAEAEAGAAHARSTRVTVGSGGGAGGRGSIPVDQIRPIPPELLEAARREIEQAHGQRLADEICGEFRNDNE